MGPRRDDGAAGDDHLHAVADAHFEFDDFAGRKHEKVAAGGVRGGGNEDGPEFADPGFELGFALRLVGEEPERPSAGAGELDEHHFVVEVAVFGAEGGDDLADGIVDRADAGDALNEAFEQPQEKFPENIVRKETESGNEGEDDDGGSEVPDEGESLK